MVEEAKVTTANVLLCDGVNKFYEGTSTFGNRVRAMRQGNSLTADHYVNTTSYGYNTFLGWQISGDKLTDPYASVNPDIGRTKVTQVARPTITISIAEQRDVTNGDGHKSSHVSANNYPKLEENYHGHSAGTSWCDGHATMTLDARERTKRPELGDAQNNYYHLKSKK